MGLNKIKSFQLFENKDDDNFTKIIDILESDCSQFLSLLKKWRISGVYRGVPSHYFGKPILDGFWSMTPPKHREPKDTNKEISKKIDEELNKKFGVPLRSKGVFASLDISISSDYGKDPMGVKDPETFLFIPKNGFRYFWNPNVDDLFTELRDNKSFYKKNPFFWNPIEIKEFESLINGYREGEIEKIKWQEITFICSGYYLLDLDYFYNWQNYILN
jgi:hypothetical protein